MKRRINIARSSFILILSLLVTIFVSEQTASASTSDWIPTGSLNTTRGGHTATLLSNGKVLVVGGANGTTELYDPATGTWSITGSLNTPRVVHTATLLPNGKVLVAGGLTNNTPPDFGITDSAELYDPATGTWNITGSLNIARWWYTATMLANGKVLVVAGAGGENSAELYDPGTETWSLTGSLNTGRYGQTATLLEDGKVLIAGGSNDGDLTTTLNSAELYDPATGTWSITGDLNASRIMHTATLLPNGRVLVAGGYIHDMVLVRPGLSAASPTSLNGVELYDPDMGTWSVTASLKTARDSHTATLLPDGKVLVAGGDRWLPSNPPCGLTASCLSYFSHLDKAELYDSATGTWSVTATLNAARSLHTATLLREGLVLVAGGGNKTGTLNSAELYDHSVAAPLVLGSSIADAEVGIPYSGYLQIGGGQSPYVLSISNGSLPPGLSLGSSSIEGIPTVAGKKQFTIRALDQLGTVVTRTVRMKILKAVGISTINLQAGRVGKKFNASLKATDGKKPFTWSLVSGTLPPGLVFDPATAKISGTPTVGGVSTLTFRVTDSLGGNFERTLSLTIN